MRERDIYRRFKSQDDSTWSFFDPVREALELDPGSFDGLGIALACGLAGGDLDNSADYHSGEIKPWAQEILFRLDTYSEWSPSGTGIKLLGKASFDPVAESQEVEFVWDLPKKNNRPPRC
jgi:primase-polymerase (primpol)-like protein